MDATPGNSLESVATVGKHTAGRILAGAAIEKTAEINVSGTPECVNRNRIRLIRTIIASGVRKFLKLYTQGFFPTTCRVVLWGRSSKSVASSPKGEA